MKVTFYEDTDKSMDELRNLAVVQKILINARRSSTLGISTVALRTESNVDDLDLDEVRDYADSLGVGDEVRSILG